MSRSYKKTPIIGNSRGSEKKDKQIANQKFRTKSKQAIQQEKLNKLPYSVEEVYDSGSMSKDGKHYLNLEGRIYKNGKWLRK
jgi:hypothetical protein